MLFELPHFEHITVKTVNEAIAMLQEQDGKAAVIAGATDLLGLMKDRIQGPELKIPEVLINIKSIPEMSRMGVEPEGTLRIGAAVTLTHLGNHALVKERFPILSQAAHQVGTTPLRNMGTLGGNLCQRPRCMYFRHPHFLCFKKGGTSCFAVAGEHRDYHSILKLGKCVMAHPSDMAPSLMALKASAVIVGPEGERQIALQDFFLDANATRETVLRSNEFLKEVRVPEQKGKLYQIFLKQRIRHSADFALSSVAVVMKMEKGVCGEVHLVLGGVAPRPTIASDAETILRGKTWDEELLSRAADAALEGSRPLPHNRYKVGLTRAVLKRALTQLWKEATGA